MSKKTILTVTTLLVVLIFLFLSPGCGILPFLDDKGDEGNAISGSVFITPDAKYDWGPKLYVGLLDQDITNFLSENNPLSLGNLKKLQDFDSDDDSISYKMADFEEGDYYVIAFIDVNDDKKLNVNFNGDPKEPVGVYPDNESGEMQHFGSRDYDDINLTVEYINFADDFEEGTRNDTEDNATELEFTHTAPDVEDSDTLSFDSNYDNQTVEQDCDWFIIDSVAQGYSKNVRVRINSLKVDLVIEIHDNSGDTSEIDDTGNGGMEFVSLTSDSYTYPVKLKIYNGNGDKRGVYYMEWFWNYE